MTDFKVGFWYTEYGSTIVEATTLEEAEKLVHKQLEEQGLDELKYRCNDREYGVADTEEL